MNDILIINVWRGVSCSTGGAWFRFCHIHEEFVCMPGVSTPYSRVNITSGSLVRFSGSIHLSLACLISLNLLSFIRYNLFRHKLLMVILAFLLMSSLEKICRVSMVCCWSLIAYFADVFAIWFPSILTWLGIYIKVFLILLLVISYDWW